MKQIYQDLRHTIEHFWQTYNFYKTSCHQFQQWQSFCDKQTQQLLIMHAKRNTILHKIRSMLSKKYASHFEQYLSNIMTQHEYGQEKLQEWQQYQQKTLQTLIDTSHAIKKQLDQIVATDMQVQSFLCRLKHASSNTVEMKFDEDVLFLDQHSYLKNHFDTINLAYQVAHFLEKQLCKQMVVRGVFQEKMASKEQAPQVRTLPSAIHVK